MKGDESMKEECKQKILLAYAMGYHWLNHGIEILCMRYGTEFVAECMVELGLDMEDIL